MKPRRVYWDSDCFLGWLKEEPDKEDLCGLVLEEAEAGRILLVTSALTIAEVLHLKGNRPISNDDKEMVIDFFKRDYIAVRNVTRRIAENAREYVWNHGVKPKDAIHVATALDARLTLLNTFDVKLLNKSGQLGEPGRLIIGKPEAISSSAIAQEETK